MALEKLKKFLVENRQQLSELPLAPFAGLGKILGRENEIGFPQLVEPAKYSDVKFGSIDTNLIVYLRYLVQSGLRKESVESWAEKLLRYSEVRGLIPKRLYFPECDNYKLSAQLLATFFLEHFASCNDLRFLNASLKMNDITNKQRKMKLQMGKNLRRLLEAKNTILEQLFMESL